jgi:hypothetical protein
LCASGKGFLEKSTKRASWARPAQQGEGAQPIRWLRLGKQVRGEVLAGFLGCLRDAACRTRGAVASIDTCAIQRFSKPTPQPLGQSVAAQRRATRATQDSTTRETSCSPQGWRDTRLARIADLAQSAERAKLAGPISTPGSA